MRTLRSIAIAILIPLVAPLAADAQQPTKPARVGVLAGAAPTFDPTRPDAGAFAAGLRDHGYVVGQNVVLEFRTAKALGLRLPPSVLARATQLIE